MVWYSPGISLTRAYYEVYIYRLRNLDRARPMKNSAWLYWASNVCALSCVTTWPPSQTQYCSIRKWSTAIFLTFGHPCLTAVHNDELGSSQAPPKTVSPLQLVFYGMVQATDCEETISSSRWAVQVPYPAYQVHGQVSPIYILQYLSCLST